MKNEKLIENILVAVFLFTLIIYSTTSSSNTLLLFILLLISGFTISIIKINKATKSSNSLKSKIYFSFILSFIYFFPVIFFWFSKDHSNMLDYGLIAAIIIVPLTMLFGVISFLIGTILSIKRKTRNNFNHNIKLPSLIATIASIILLFIFFFNFLISKSAVIIGSDKLCNATLSFPDNNSHMFNSNFKPFCISQVSIAKNDEAICKNIHNIFYEDACRSQLTINNKDIKICFDSLQPFVGSKCETAFRKLENEIYNILHNHLHPDIIYAIKTTPYLGIYYDEFKADKFIPLIKNITKNGSIDSKKESLEILFTWAVGGTIQESKVILRNEILPLLKNQPELQEYTNKINSRLRMTEVK